MYAQAIAAMWPTTIARKLVVSWPGVAATMRIVGASAANSHGCLIQLPIAPMSTISAAETIGTQNICRTGAIEPPRIKDVSFANDGASALARMAAGVG
jgi:hypothetical protein